MTEPKYSHSFTLSASQEDTLKKARTQGYSIPAILMEGCEHIIENKDKEA